MSTLALSLRVRSLRLLGITAVTLAAGLPLSAGAGYVQSNLVSDIPGLAIITDPNLKNPWGISHSATSPFWVSDQGTGLSTLYTVNTVVGVTKNALQVTIPTTATGPQGPTGQVNNNTSAFIVNVNPASFIFANLNGTISAWNNSAGTNAQIKATTVGAVYTGLAIGTNATGPKLYAANGAQNRIDVFDGSFAPVTLGPNAFSNPAVGALVPFNVQNIGGNIYVTYAPAGRAAQIAAPEGNGAVAVFDTSGNLIQTLITDGKLASPWGITRAPADFGEFSGDLLVGNFSFVASEINAYDPLTGDLQGTIPLDIGGNTPGGLWGLIVGNGGNGGLADTVYFVNAINGEVNGLFGSLTPAVPEPATLALLALGLAGLGFRRRA